MQLVRDASDEEKELSSDFRALVVFLTELRDAVENFLVGHDYADYSWPAGARHWSALGQEVMLHARLVPGYCHDLEVSLSVDFAEGLHEIRICDDVEYLVSQIMPRVLVEMAFWEPLPEKKHPDSP